MNMGRVTNWIVELLEDEAGKLYLEYTAEHETKTHRNDAVLDVYRVHEDGTCEGRNIYYSCYAGYIVKFPNEYHSYYYGNSRVGIEDYETCRPIPFPCHEKITEGHKFLISRKYPEFASYVLPHIKCKYLDNVFHILQAWIQHKEVEYLVKCGYYTLISNKSFWKMTKNMTKKVSRFIMKNPGLDLCLRDIQLILRENLTTEEVIQYRNSPFRKYSYKVYLYLKKQSEKCYEGNDSRTAYQYADYRAMLSNSAHNPDEDYWKYPSNIAEFHDRLVDEETARREAARRQYELEHAAEMEHQERIEKAKAIKLAKGFHKRAESWPCLEIDGYTIYATSDINEWEKQAKILHQCILSARYNERMANGNGDIIFIRKNGKPIATAQVYGYKEIGQFYADEHSGTPKGSLPTDEVRAAFNEYLTQAKAWRKAKRARRAA